MYSASGSSGASGSQNNDTNAAFQFGSYSTGSNNNMAIYAIIGVVAIWVLANKKGRK